VSTIVGVMTLLFGASGVLGELRDALNTIWEVQPKKGSALWTLVRDNFLNFGMVLAIGFLLMVSLLLSSGVAALSKRFESIWSLPPPVWAIIAFLLSFAVITMLVAIIFKALPDARVQWKDVRMGSFLTAAFFELGKSGLAWYLGRESTSSPYGAAGAVVLLLLWVYYASCILFFGAEFTQVYAAANGHVIVPDEHGEPLKAHDRIEQGLALPQNVAAESGRGDTTRDGGGMKPPLWKHRLLEPILKYVEARGMLASLEAKEALQKTVGILIVGFAAIIAIFAAWLLLATALVGWITSYFQWSWVAAAAAAGGLHVVFAAAFIGIVWWRYARAAWFQDTIQELKKDRLWLRGKTS